MKLILTRHGETNDNKAKIIQGHKNSELSNLGIEQAKKVAKRLKLENFEKIYSSDLQRAANTAQKIHKYHKNTPIEHTTELREIDFGDWNGKYIPEINFDIIPENHEGTLNFHNRICNFIESLYLKHQNDTILIVAHAGCITTLLTKILDKQPNQLFEINQGNTAINVINYNGKNFELEFYNCTKHLE